MKHLLNLGLLLIATTAIAQNEPASRVRVRSQNQLLSGGVMSRVQSGEFARDLAAAVQLQVSMGDEQAKAFAVRLLAATLSDKPSEQGAGTSDPEWGDFVRISGGVLHTHDVGFKQFTLANIYTRAQRQQTQEQKAYAKFLSQAESALRVATTNDANVALFRANLLRAIPRERRWARGTLVTIRTAQEDGSIEDKLALMDRLSLTLGGGGPDEAKYFAGLSYMFNRYVGLTVGFGLEDTAKAKSRLSVGLQLDSGVLGAIFGGGKKKEDSGG